MRWSLVPAALVALLVLVALALHLVGRTLPADHIAERERDVPAPLDLVSQRIGDVGAQPRWRRGVTAIQIQSRIGGIIRYAEVSGSDRILFEMSAQSNGRRFESRIVSTDLPFGGRWIVSLTPAGTQRTRVHIREEGVVHLPAFRTVSHYFIGHTETMDAYLEDLATSLEERR